MTSVPPLDIHYLGRGIQEHRVIGLTLRGEAMMGEPYRLVTSPSSGVLSLLIRVTLCSGQPVKPLWTLLNFADITRVQVRPATFEPCEVPCEYQHE